MSSNYILLDKPITLSPLQAINKLKILNPKLQNQKVGYAGRLDPMAEGLLLLLIGDENKKRKQYERLDKEYEFEVLLGIETDSYDILGLIEKIHEEDLEIRNLELEISKVLNKITRTLEQPYPPYSATRVNGKPLYYWAREGKIDQVTIPRKKITIHSLELNTVTPVKMSDIYPEVVSRIQAVKGKFRQTKIIKKWNQTVEQYSNLAIKQLSFNISCSSGTYVRSIAHQIGQKLGFGGIAYTIKRIMIGPYKLKDALNISNIKQDSTHRKQAH